MPSPHLSQSGESKSAWRVILPRIGGYSLLEKLFESSVCSIYKARQDRLGRLVVLKLLPEFPPPADLVLERFNRAAYVYAQVVHANLPVLYETGTVDGHHYAALEYVQGRSLQDLLLEHGRTSERRATAVGLQAARALAALHDKGIVHRNVKPKNCLLDAEGRLRVVGLGLAKCDAACFSKHLDAQPIGTPHYMAPEMIRGQTADPRSDLYSLGVSLYVMVTGHPPFPQGVPAAVMARHLYEEPKPLSLWRPDLSTDFVTLVEEMMAKRLDARTGSAREVVRRLERLAARPACASPSGGAPPAGPPSPCASVRAQRVWGPGVLFLASLSAVLLSGLAGFALFQVLAPKSTRSSDAATSGDPQAAAGSFRVPFAAAPPPAVRPEAVAPSAEREAGAALPQEFEYRRLKELEEVFGRDVRRGVREWEAFLRAYPRAPEAFRVDAEQHVRRFKQAGLQPRREAPALRGADADGEALDF